MMERRSQRRRNSESACPMTAEQYADLIGRLSHVENAVKPLPCMIKKLDEILLKVSMAKGVLVGMKLGAFGVIVAFSAAALVVWGFLTGKISIKDIFGMML